MGGRVTFPYRLIIRRAFWDAGECSSYPLWLVCCKDLTWIDLTEPSPLVLETTVSRLEAVLLCVKILNSCDIERKQAEALGCLVLRAVTHELRYLGRNPWSNKYFYYFEKLQKFGRYSPRTGKCRMFHWPEALGEGSYNLKCLTQGGGGVMMPQPHPWGISGGWSAVKDVDITEVFRSWTFVSRLLLFRGVADLLRRKSTSPAANAVRCTLHF